MKRLILAAAMVSLLSVIGSAQTTGSDQQQGTVVSGGSDYERPKPSERAKKYFKSMFGPVALASVGGIAAVGTIRNRPEEWGKKPEGFGRRFASGMAQNVIRQSFIFGLDEALSVDSGFYRSKKRDLGSKVSNALLSTVTARNKSGKRVVGAPRIIGSFAAPVISRELWYPDRFNYKDGLKSGAVSLGINALVNLFREFTKK